MTRYSEFTLAAVQAAPILQLHVNGRPLERVVGLAAADPVARLAAEASGASAPIEPAPAGDVGLRRGV